MVSQGAHWGLSGGCFNPQPYKPTYLPIDINNSINYILNSDPKNVLFIIVLSFELVKNH